MRIQSGVTIKDDNAERSKSGKFWFAWENFNFFTISINLIFNLVN